MSSTESEIPISIEGVGQDGKQYYWAGFDKMRGAFFAGALKPEREVTAPPEIQLTAAETPGSIKTVGK